jgi:hypothetical protein
LTLSQYRNLAVLCLVGGVFFLAAGQSGFRGGVDLGLGVTLFALAIAFVALRRYVEKRLDAPLEYWRDQQRRLGGTLWGATSAVTAIGVLGLLLALLVGEAWVAGCVLGVAALPALLIVGKLTGQIGTY